MYKPNQLTEEEFNSLVYKIAKPTFNFAMRRLNKEILDGKKYKSLDINHFFNVIVASISSVDANMLRWMQNFYKIKTNQEIDFPSLKEILIKSLDENLKILVQ